MKKILLLTSIAACLSLSKTYASSIEDLETFQNNNADYSYTELKNSSCITEYHNHIQSYHSEKRDLNFGFERVTPETEQWWRNYISLELLSIYSQRIEDEKDCYGGELQDIDLIKVDEIIQRGCGYPDEDYWMFKDEFAPFAENYIPFNHESDFLNAVRGFVSYLDLSRDGNTYISYASTEPVNPEDPLSRSSFSDKRKTTHGQRDSYGCPLKRHYSDVRPDIVLSMAARCEKGVFYSALGAHKNIMYPTYRTMAEDPREELPYYKGISPLFHAVTANFVRELGQDIDVALVRPLSVMRDILLDMDVPSFAGAGKSGETSDEVPYLLRKLFLEESGDSSVEFHNNPLVFVFPKEGKIFQMPSDYWFCKSPFGGYTDFRELKKMMAQHNRIQIRTGHPEERITKFSDIKEANPFVTIPLESLAEYRNSLELAE